MAVFFYYILKKTFDMRYWLFITLLLSSFMVKANMASPIDYGTEMGNAFSSKDIDILKEYIFVKIDKDFKTAQYKIIYYIQSDSIEVQIPLLFHANDYKEDFKVSLDNKRIQLLDVPASLFSTEDSIFSGFSHNFIINSAEENHHFLKVRWNEEAYQTIHSADLKYFKTNVTKGKHIITVTYKAYASVNRNGWVKNYFFEYDLYPAKFWKRFGGLDIRIDASEHSGKTFSNLLKNPLPPKTKKVFSFDSVPSDNFVISFQPEVNFIAKGLIFIGPEGLMFLLAMILLIIHFITLIKLRRKNPKKSRHGIHFAMLLIFPFLILLSYPFIINFIDMVIGLHASGYHGYVFLMVFFYPLLFPVYGLLVWVFDFFLKRKITQDQAK